MEVVQTVFQERNSQRFGEHGGVIDVSKISSQDRMLQRTVEQTLGESRLSRERVRQRTAWHIDDVAQELLALLKQQSVSLVILTASSVTRSTTRKWRSWSGLIRCSSGRIS